MANKDPSKTEKPTGKKISEARTDGNVMTSQDVASFVMIFGGAVMLLFVIPNLREYYETAFKTLLDNDCRHSWNEQELRKGAFTAIMVVARVVLPFCVGAILLAVIVMRAQVGKYFSPKALKWKLSALNPQKGMMSMLPSKQNMIKLGLTLSKLAVIGYLAYVTIKGDFEDFIKLPIMPVLVSVNWLAWRCIILVFRILLLYAVIAVIDYIVKKRKYVDDLMMTKQEVKDERKNAEGDPQVKAKIRTKMRQLLRSSMMTSVPSADVVITNPTHVAVALKYEFGSYAPKVVAKGLRKSAERIKFLAKKNEIPIVEAPPLARSLYRNTDIGGFIPSEFFGAVAAVLAKLQKNGKKSFI